MQVAVAAHAFRSQLPYGVCFFFSFYSLQLITIEMRGKDEETLFTVRSHVCRLFTVSNKSPDDCVCVRLRVTTDKILI